MDKKVTVVVLTKNEEHHIVDVIQNAKTITEHVLIVDSGSTDRTVELAEASGAKVVYRAWDNDFSAQRNFALQYVNTDWVLYLDADERMNEELCKDILRSLKANNDEQYVIKRMSIAFGKKFCYGVLRPDYVPRLFKSTKVKWVNKVHEKPLCGDKSVVLNGYIEHYTYNSWEQWLVKFNHYTTIWAEDAFLKGKKVNLSTAFAHAFFGFFQMAVLRRGVLDGWMGLALCCQHFFYTLMKYLKLIDLNKIR